jgi:shikimate kinase
VNSNEYQDGGNTDRLNSVRMSRVLFEDLMQDIPEVGSIAADFEGISDQRAYPQGVNVVLVGLSGSGKTSTGWHLAKSLGWGFIDLDEWIEKRAGKKISDIFAKDGEEEFRKLEIQALQDIKLVKNHVIATGGGIASSDEIWNLAKSFGVIVWLDTTIAEMARRLVSKSQLEKRPLLAHVSDTGSKLELLAKIEVEIQKQLVSRKSRLETATIALTLTFVPPDIAAQLIHSVLKKGGHLRPRRNT